MTHKRIKIKIRQTNKRPISIEQFVALNVYIKQQERNEHSEIIKWRNRMWVRTPRITRNVPGRTLAAITHFPLLCAFPPRQSKNHPLQHPFSHISISPQNLNLFQKGKSPISFLLFFSFFFKFFFLCISINLPKIQTVEGNPLSFLLFPFLSENQNASFFLCRVFSFHMYAATLILFSLQKYFFYILWVHVP